MRARRMACALVAGVLTGCGGPVVVPLEPSHSAQALTPPVSVAAERPPVAAAQPVFLPAPFAPSWSFIYAAYFGPGSTGSCGRSASCHVAEMHDSTSAYDWLSRRGYIDGTRSALVSRSNSCLRWFGGNMPPQLRDPGDDAKRDLEAWVEAGARDD